MLFVETIVAFGLLVSWRAPETAAGRWLHRHLIATLAARLHRITRGQIVVALLMAAMVVGAMWLGRDAPRIMALASPDVVLLLGSVETSLYIDAVLTAVLTWSAVRLMPAKIGKRGRPARSVRRGRRSARAHRHPSNDNEDAEGRTLRAA